MRSLKRWINSISLTLMGIFLMGIFSFSKKQTNHLKDNRNHNEIVSTNVTSVILSDLPPNTSNTRFGSIDAFSTIIVRPSLSIRGFNSSTLTGGTAYGFGLKQIIEEYFNGEFTITPVVDEIISQANANLITPQGSLDEKRLVLDTNSRITQSRAFVALATYVLEKNGYITESTNLFGKAHSQALQSLLEAFLNPPGDNHIGLDLLTDDGWNVTENALNIAVNYDNIDAVKLPRSLANMARAIDLYLALENAYKYYADNGLEDNEHYYGSDANQTPLLSSQQRSDLLEHYGMNLKSFYKFNLLEFGDITEVIEAGISGAIFEAIINQISSAVDLSLNELQPGNWSFKNFLGIGYGSLAMNYSTSNEPFSEYFYHAYRTTFMLETQDRTKYWSYQTSNGKRYWAEGPFYFHFTLRELIPFWHAVRGSGLYSNGQISYNGLVIQDPFFNSDFTDPLEWLADIVTPDGSTPPLDDSNKKPMENSSVLRWKSSYGDPNVGSKYSAINNFGNNLQYGSAPDLLLVELGIPRNIGSSQIPDNNITNSTGEDQQLIIRNGSGSDLHYLLMNGERGDATIRGEGHEQPDQLQLLYYLGNTSYLMDSGYKSNGLENSTWNNYIYHNNLAYTDGWNSHPPKKGWTVNPILNSNFKPRMVSDDHPVLSLTAEDQGSISVLKGYMRLLEYTEWGPDDDRLDRFADYFRKVLYIDDTNPYIIDLNSIEGFSYYFPDPWTNASYYEDYSGGLNDIKYRLKYLTGANGHEIITRNNQKWSKFVFNSADDLYLYANFVEYDNQNIQSGILEIEEVEDTPFNSRTLKLNHEGHRILNTVSFIQITESEPYSIPTPIVNDANRSHQVWRWSQDSNTLDILVKRSKRNLSEYNQVLNFDINENGYFIPGLQLPIGKEYGFARFQKSSNGVWEIDSNYQVNLIRQPNTFVYINGNSIGNKTFSFNSKIYVADNATVNINGDVTIQSGTKVYMGTGAILNVNASGTITADGVTFRTISGSTASADRWKHIILLTDYSQTSQGNTFTNCSFEGAEKALYSASYANLVERSTFSNNHTAVYSTSDLIELRGVTMENGTNGIVSRGTGTVRINSVYNTSGFERASEISGHSKGVRIYDYGNAYVHHTKLSGNDYHVYANEQGRLYAGKYEQDGSKGYNRFALANIYDIYNSAVTSTGATWTAQANYNFWGSTSSAPPSSRFFGSVNRNFPLTCDPTVDGEYCDPQGSGSGGGGDDGPCLIGSPDCPSDEPVPEAPPGELPLLSLETGTSQTTSSASSTDTAAPKWVRSTVHGLLAYITTHPEDPRLYELLQETYHLLQAYDSGQSLREQLQFDQKLEQ